MHDLMAKPTKGVRLSQEVIDATSAYARRSGRTFSNAVDWLLREKLGLSEPETNPPRSGTATPGAKAQGASPPPGQRRRVRRLAAASGTGRPLLPATAGPIFQCEFLAIPRGQAYGRCIDNQDHAYRLMFD